MNAGAAPIMKPASETLGSPSHKAVTHLGRNTAHKINEQFGIGPTLRELLKLVDGPRRPEVLALIDAGVRDRVDAELTALRIDLLPA